MTNVFWGFVATVFIGMQILVGVVSEDVDTQFDPTAEGSIANLLQVEEHTEGAQDPFRFLTSVRNFFSSTATIATWDYPFFDGGWNYFRMFLLGLSAAAMFGVMVTACWRCCCSVRVVISPSSWDYVALLLF